jgi:hypothetical protein
MALASSLLMFAGSPQTLLAVATGQESFLVLIDILPAYGRQVTGELQQTLIDFYFSLQRLLQNWTFASQVAKDVKQTYAWTHPSSLAGLFAKQLQSAEQRGSRPARVAELFVGACPRVKLVLSGLNGDPCPLPSPSVNRLG